MSANPIQIRQAEENEAPLLLTILHAAFKEYRGRLDPPSGVHAETMASVQTKLKTARAAIGLVGNEAAGCVFYEQKEDHLYLGRLSVLPRFRKAGVGRALIEYVEMQAVNLNVSRVRLGVRIALPQLKTYYERLGYRIISHETHPGYSQPTYVMMEKNL
jgi:predicted N-acetyltransferase YhbS